VIAHMTPPAPTSTERERLAALERYEMLDTPAEAEFDDLTALAAQICGTPIALISLVDARRQWFKSNVGLDATETSREVSFCGHAIHGRHLLEVPNTLEEFLFYDNPLVTGAPNIRFYAGMPLTTPDGQNLGTLCVMDRVTHYLTQTQREALGRLGRQVMNQMELRLTIRRLAAASQDLRELEGRSRLIVEAAPHALVMVDEQGQIIQANSRTEQLFGYSRDELIGQPVEMLLPERLRRAKSQNGLGVFGGARPGAKKKKKGRELTGLRKNGTQFPIEISAGSVSTSAGFFVLASINDVTERQRMLSQINRLKRELTQKDRKIEPADHQRTDFSAAANDLKSPLRSISSLANWLVTSYANRLDGAGREQLNLLALKLRRLNALVDGVFACPVRSRSHEALEIAEVFSPAELPSAAASRVRSRNLVDRSLSEIVAGPGYSNERVQNAADESVCDERVSEIAIAV